jgi:hypothetical protein
MLAQVLIAEADAFVASCDMVMGRSARSRPALGLSRFGAPRCEIGATSVRRTKSAAILPNWARRTQSLGTLLPILPGGLFTSNRNVHDADRIIHATELAGPARVMIERLGSVVQVRAGILDEGYPAGRAQRALTEFDIFMGATQKLSPRRARRDER